ncbi:MAG: antibiotic biosynthesis monooxygenase [Pseudotabrizicola sp.]|uniref:putative quinol monooxygenase n=1 Tax=Pseudotabrizicola sp. TaxID=2939647 RepID=UPI00271A684B|nr:antibiotic biosynthesis monooxygenase [Pseudotabrizicola sp.]MDO8882394.1 antibiotic biosynthesis monooxygenase [Pseudotabrizicola sp.]MDP2082604.1 antibiotic biosynthesis monooxygenase [Pseudotabrizicola sp.]MDZ7573500.1 antibiotic biosynthesis monooxygenase [Pseudotabrizicola sp.]
MIRLKGHLICMSQAEADVVRAHLPEHIRLSREEPGCLSFNVAQTDDPMIWDVQESFRTRADFDAHQTRTRASLWFDATRHILRDFRVEELRD